MALEKPGKLGIFFSYFVATLFNHVTLTKIFSMGSTFQLY